MKVCIVKVADVYVNYEILGVDGIKSAITEIIEDDDYVDIVEFAIDGDKVTEGIVCGLAKYLGNNSICNGSYCCVNSLFVYILFYKPAYTGSNFSNKLGSQFTSGTTPCSPVIILKQNVATGAYVDIALIDVQNILEERLIKIGIEVSASGKLQTYTFVNTHLEHIYKSYGPTFVEKNYLYDTIDVCGFQLYVTEKVTEEDKTPSNYNSLGSVLCKHDVYGDIYIALAKPNECDDKTYCLLDGDLFARVCHIIEKGKTGSKVMVPKTMTVDAEVLMLLPHIALFSLVD